MTDLADCRLCEWRCGANRLKGERGVCRVGEPEVVAVSCSTTLHSISVTLAGCCYRCLHCNAYRISQYPDPRWWYGRRMTPGEVVDAVWTARERCAEPGLDTISFTGGDPIIHLPFIEEVAAVVKERGLPLGIGIATGGFSTVPALRRIIGLCSTITLEIKAFDDNVHRALTGAPAAPVLRNAEILATEAREKIRVFRTVVIPGMTDPEILKIAEYIASLDPEIPYRLIGFRPNFALYYHPGPGKEEMERAAQRCREAGLSDVAWSGYYPQTVQPEIKAAAEKIAPRYGGSSEAALTAAYAADLGCPTHPRSCGTCPLRDRCPATLREPWNRR